MLDFKVSVESYASQLYDILRDFLNEKVSTEEYIDRERQL